MVFFFFIETSPHAYPEKLFLRKKKKDNFLEVLSNSSKYFILYTISSNNPIFFFFFLKVCGDELANEWTIPWSQSGRLGRFIKKLLNDNLRNHTLILIPKQ